MSHSKCWILLGAQTLKVCATITRRQLRARKAQGQFWIADLGLLEEDVPRKAGGESVPVQNTYRDDWEMME